MKKKSVMLIIPEHFEFYKELILSFQNVGLEIVFLFVTDKPFKYKNLKERLKSFIHKNLLNHRGFKKQLIYDKENRTLLSQLESIEGTVDYALIIRPDLLGIDTLFHIKEKVNKMVGYQWDGLNRFPTVFDCINIFDKFYVFDQNDYEQYGDVYGNLFLTTNFYLEISQPKEVVVKPKSICFVGSYLENRMPYVEELVNFLNQESFDVDIKLLCDKDKIVQKYKDSGIEFISKPLTYGEMVHHVQSYEVLLDFDNSVIHQGLSFRVFEALFYKKKIITNNELVKDYDFYHPNNIFIWDRQNLSVLNSFLNTPMVRIEPQIIEKYSFNSWIKKVLA